MDSSPPRKRKRGEKHPYLSGNFAPISKICPLKPCSYTGTIPDELLGGQYVRNGGNPVSNEDLGREAHWFDGDGMLTGVLFARHGDKGGNAVQPQFVNQFIVTDILQTNLSTPALQKPILPSIATLINPASTLVQICLSVFRTVLLVILSYIPGAGPRIRKISVANTSIMYHDGRALATCESGPPLRIALPSLETVGWYNGKKAEGESGPGDDGDDGDAFGGGGLFHFMKEWTTAHPKVDPNTNEMILFHSTFVPPYVHYSIIPATHKPFEILPERARLVNAPVPGVSSAKMMHDFGVSRMHTIIMDLPLTLDPLLLLRNKPVISYDATNPSRFGIFPRRSPQDVRWFRTSACCIFHTANTWDVVDKDGALASVDMLACRLTSASVVFNAGNIAMPALTRLPANGAKKPLPRLDEHKAPDTSYKHGPAMESIDSEGEALLQKLKDEGVDDISAAEDEQCRLYYYSFSMKDQDTIDYEFALSDVPFEFPSVRPDKEMSSAKYVYGCTTTASNFNSALGRAVRIDGLIKFDVQTLIAKGRHSPPEREHGCVDPRTVSQIVQSRSTTDAIQIFQPPPNIYAQEPRFVASKTGTAEDDGYLVAYMFDETQLSSEGEASAGAVSELWIIDAKGMRDVLAKVQLPQRVPYGLHGLWFSERQMQEQRGYESTRALTATDGRKGRARTAKRISNALVRAMGG